MAKTKVLISCSVTAQLICIFVFAYAKSRLSHNEAHIIVHEEKENCELGVASWELRVEH